MRTLYIGLEATARLSAAILCGALLFIGYFVGRNHTVAYLALPVGIGLWALTLMATKHLRLSKVLQVVAMILGFLTAGVVVLAISLSNLEMD
jgi:hypothetical protein